MADNKNMELDDEMMVKATGGEGEEGAPEARFSVGDRVIIRGAEDHDSVVKEVHFTGDIVNNSWKYLVHMVSDSTGLTSEVYKFESELSPA